MAKVLIYEDNGNDLVGRYSHLNKKHDVHVRYMIPFSLMAMGFEETKKHACENGFKPENIQKLVEGKYDAANESADVYFLDGLGGYCLELIKQLPKDKAFINSSDHSIVTKAKSQGFNVVENESLGEIVERISGQC